MLLHNSEVEVAIIKRWKALKKDSKAQQLDVKVVHPYPIVDTLLAITYKAEKEGNEKVLREMQTLHMRWL